MRSDNSRHVVEAARQRAEQTRERAVAALRRMNVTGQRITFDTVARQARVSRSWLYTQDDLRAEIERRRTAASRTAGPAVPRRQHCSDASLRQRLDLATTRLRELEADNKQLRQALAEALGDNRLITARAPRHDTPNPTTSEPARAPSPTASRTPSTTRTRTSEP